MRDPCCSEPPTPGERIECRSFRRISQSKHSRRIVPISRSQNAFACGHRTAHGSGRRTSGSSTTSTVDRCGKHRNEERNRCTTNAACARGRCRARHPDRSEGRPGHVPRSRGRHAQRLQGEPKDDRDVDAKRRINKHLAPFFGNKRLSSITASDIRAYIAKRLADTYLAHPARRVKRATARGRNCPRCGGPSQLARSIAS